MEAAGGVLLVAASIVAIMCANSPTSGLYVQLLDIPAAFRI